MYLDGRENPVWNEEDRQRFLKLVGFNLIEQKALTVFSDTVLSENPFLPFCGRNLAVKARKGGRQETASSLVIIIPNRYCQTTLSDIS
jgi:hypothetical protein